MEEKTTIDITLLQKMVSNFNDNWREQRLLKEWNGDYEALAK